MNAPATRFARQARRLDVTGVCTLVDGTPFPFRIADPDFTAFGKSESAAIKRFKRIADERDINRFVRGAA